MKLLKPTELYCFNKIKKGKQIKGHGNHSLRSKMCKEKVGTFCQQHGVETIRASSAQNKRGRKKKNNKRNEKRKTCLL